MANYKFNNAYHDIDADDIWKKLVDSIQVDTEFQSVGKAHRTYKIESVQSEVISFSGDRRKEVEDIDQSSFVDVLSKLKTMEVFNTNSSKHHFKGTLIYAKRSPIFGLLLTKEIIEKT